jgi:hypothetical protein
VSTPESTKEIRRAARGDWPVVKTTLSEQDNAAHGIAPEAALAMMWQLALDAWAMTGKSLPDYTRAEAPVRCFRLGKGGPDDVD